MQAQDSEFASATDAAHLVTAADFADETDEAMLTEAEASCIHPDTFRPQVRSLRRRSPERDEDLAELVAVRGREAAQWLHVEASLPTGLIPVYLAGRWQFVRELLASALTTAGASRRPDLALRYLLRVRPWRWAATVIGAPGNPTVLISRPLLQLEQLDDLLVHELATAALQRPSKRQEIERTLARAEVHGATSHQLAAALSERGAAEGEQVERLARRYRTVLRAVHGKTPGERTASALARARQAAGLDFAAAEL